MAFDPDSRPGALLCAWFEVDRRDRADFVAFHDREHLLERMAVPGFRRAARFVGAGSPTDYLTVYEVDTLATLTSEAYVERLNHPTEWSRKMLPVLRNSRRAVVKLDHAVGSIRGACLLSMVWPGAAPPELDAEAIAGRSGIVTVRLGRFDVDASNLATAESRSIDAREQSRGTAMLVEGVSLDALDAVRGDLIESTAPGRSGLYRLEVNLG